jgi:hypothetical protein
MIFQPNSKHLYAVTILAIFMANNHIKRDQAVDTLRTVTPDKAFYFYKAIGQPLGPTSRSFSEFAATVKGIDPASVRFHVERGDLKVGSGCWGTSHWRVRSRHYAARKSRPKSFERR